MQLWLPRKVTLPTKWHTNSHQLDGGFYLNFACECVYRTKKRINYQCYFVSCSVQLGDVGTIACAGIYSPGSTGHSNPGWRSYGIYGCTARQSSFTMCCLRPRFLCCFPSLVSLNTIIQSRSSNKFDALLIKTSLVAWWHFMWTRALEQSKWRSIPSEKHSVSLFSYCGTVAQTGR